MLKPLVQGDVSERVCVKEEEKNLIVTTHFCNGWQKGWQDDIVAEKPEASQQPRQGQGRRDG